MRGTPPGLALIAAEGYFAYSGCDSSSFIMKKNYVLDANVLLHDPHAIFKFEDNSLIIPIYAIEEIDQFKREGSERGRNARTVARLLDELRPRGSLSKGVVLDQGGA